MHSSKLRVSLTLAALLFLQGCEQESYDACPSYPIAGNAVADELEANCADCEATWEWLGRVAKLKEQLDLCRKDR